MHRHNAPVGVEVGHQGNVVGRAGLGGPQLEHNLGLRHPKRCFLVGVVVLHGKCLGADHPALRCRHLSTETIMGVPVLLSIGYCICKLMAARPWLCRRHARKHER